MQKCSQRGKCTVCDTEADQHRDMKRTLSLPALCALSPSQHVSPVDSAVPLYKLSVMGWGPSRWGAHLNRFSGASNAHKLFAAASATHCQCIYFTPS